MCLPFGETVIGHSGSLPVYMDTLLTGCPWSHPVAAFVVLSKPYMGMIMGG